jgi:hypothetical protein
MFKLFKEVNKMPRTSDNDKKAKDNNAKNHEKNLQHEQNLKLGGKKTYSKEVDHK